MHNNGGRAKTMKSTSHLFFVVFFAIIIAISLAINIFGYEPTYEDVILEYSAWVLFGLSLAIWLSEKYKKLYLFFVLSGAFLAIICFLQVQGLMETQQLWHKIFRTLVIPFSIYIYITMFISEKWSLIKKT